MSTELITWVMNWHWGWQVFWGLIVLGLFIQIGEWAVKPTEDKIMDVKIWSLQFTAWTLNLIVTLIGVTVLCAVFYFGLLALANI